MSIRVEGTDSVKRDPTTKKQTIVSAAVCLSTMPYTLDTSAKSMTSTALTLNPNLYFAIIRSLFAYLIEMEF